MANFKEVLKNRNFFFLWIGQIISQFGDRLNQMALIALIYARAPGSTLQLAKVMSFTIIPVFLVGPIAASYVDRWNRRRTMIFCDFLRAAFVILIPFFFLKQENLLPLYIVIFCVFSVSRFFVPAKMAIIPELVSQEKLLLANSLSSTTGMIAVVAGFGFGGLIVERVGPGGGFIIDALTYIISGIFIFMIASRTISSFKSEDIVMVVKDVESFYKRTLFSDIKEGWQHLAQDKDMRFVAQMFFLLWSAIGAVYVVSIVFIQKTLGSITRDLGLLAMFLGTGLFLGTLIYGRFGQRFSRPKIIFTALGVSGLILCIFTFSLKVFSSAIWAACLSLLLGLSISPIMISANTLIHEVAKENMRGRIFGSLEIVAHLAFLLFMFLSSFLAERIGRFWILLFVGAVLAIVGFGALFFKIDRRVGIPNVQGKSGSA